VTSLASPSSVAPERHQPSPDQPPRRRVDGAPRVVVAEDDDDLRALLCLALGADGYEVEEAADGDAFLRLVEEGLRRPGATTAADLVITDVRMPGPTGLDVIARLRQDDPTTPVIVITGFGDQQVTRQARRLGVAHFFDKPFDLDALLRAVTRLLPPR
jgi:CheY-like chemotaxis protein